MPALGPRETEPDAWIRWLKEALVLLRRRPLPLAGWLVLSLALFWVAQQSSWAPFRNASLLFLAPLGLIVFIRLAWCADYSRRAGLAEIMPDNRDCMLALGVGAALFALFTALGPILEPPVRGFRELVQDLGLWREILDDGQPAPAPLRYTLLGPILVAGGLVGLAVTACALLLLAFGQWFLLPMLALHQAPLPPSMAVSARAYPLNPVPMTGLFGVVIISGGLVMATLGWAALALIPFLGALLYTSYRDVFLGREESEPQRILDEDEGVVPGH